mgnify:CR=1 FL=1
MTFSPLPVSHRTQMEPVSSTWTTVPSVPIGGAWISSIFRSFTLHPAEYSLRSCSTVFLSGYSFSCSLWNLTFLIGMLHNLASFNSSSIPEEILSPTTHTSDTHLIHSFPTCCPNFRSCGSLSSKYRCGAKGMSPLDTASLQALFAWSMLFFSSVSGSFPTGRYGEQINTYFLLKK